MGSPKTALIIAGAAAKGPFAAGALSILATADPERFSITRVVGTSAGSLNGAVYAAGLRVGQPQAAALLLQELWRDRARLPWILSQRFRTALLRGAIESFRDRPTAHEIRLQMLVTSLPGLISRIDGRRYTTFEEAYSYQTADFASAASIEVMAEVGIASSSLPLLFAPRAVRGRGPYWDGGLVNNTPIGRAIEDDAQIDRLLIVSPDPAVAAPQKSYGRFSLGRLERIAVDERLYRDIRTARAFNHDLERLRALGVDPERLRATLKWRPLELIEIRPAQELPGGALSGFLSRALRQTYIDEGRRTAEQVLAAGDGA
jgi:predicted acylesterase/phospholipase RssA